MGSVSGVSEESEGEWTDGDRVGVFAVELRGSQSVRFGVRGEITHLQAVGSHESELAKQELDSIDPHHPVPRAINHDPVPAFSSAPVPLRASEDSPDSIKQALLLPAQVLANLATPFEPFSHLLALLLDLVVRRFGMAEARKPS